MRITIVLHLLKTIENQKWTCAWNFKHQTKHIIS